MIIDSLGGVDSFDMLDEFVAFEQGNSLILLDTVQDNRIKMHNHVNPIKSICFCGNNLIASISQGFKNQLIISEYQTLTRVFHDYLPQSEKQVTALYMKYHNYLYIIEVNTGYRVLVLDIKQLKLLFIQDIENLEICTALIVLPTKPMTKLGTVEVNQLKLWNVDTTKATLTNKITVKSIKHISVNVTLSLIVVILQNGALYILNSEGDLVSQLKTNDQEFTAGTSLDQYLYLCTMNNKIFVYEATTLHFVKQMDLINGSSIQQNRYCTEILHTNTLLSYRVNDGTLVTREILRNTIIDQQIGHQGRVNQCQWDPMSRNTFYSVSSDGTFGSISSTGDKFKLTKHPLQKLQQYNKIKCVAVDNYRDDIYLGDNKGQLYVYSLGDYTIKRCVQLAQNLSVKDIVFSPAFQYLGVAFKNGFTILLDCENQLKPMLKLEDSIANVKYTSIRLFQVEFNLVQINQSNTIKHYYLPRQDKHFNSLTILNQHQVRQHQIEKAENMLSALAINIFTVDGIITGYDLHPSKDYVLILSSFGLVYIFKLQSGELRAKITVPPYSKHLKIDKSGLYFAIAHLPLVDMSTNTQSVLEIPSRDYISNNQRINSKIPPTNIRIYECGTGLLAESIQNICSITHIEFSIDGQYLVVSGKNGKLSLWGLNEDLVTSAIEVIEGMKVNPFFWRDYPIYIDETDIQEQDVLDVTLLHKKQPGRQILKQSKYKYPINPHQINPTTQPSRQITQQSASQVQQIQLQL